MESVKERIQKLCKLRGISLHKLEVDLVFGNSTIRKWDKTQPRIDKLQAVADYSSFSMTAHYTHTDIESLSRAAELLETVFEIEENN